MKIYQFRFVVFFVERRGPAIAPRLTLNLRNHPAPALSPIALVFSRDSALHGLRPERRWAGLCGCSDRTRMHRKRSQPLQQIRIGALESVTEKHRRFHGKI